MILVDTSVWIGHLRSHDDELARRLLDGQVACHSFIVGELACGNLKDRHQVLSLLQALPAVTMAEHEEALVTVDRHRLFGRGLGWIDIHLLTSCLLSQCDLWTLDKPLAEAAGRLGVHHT